LGLGQSRGAEKRRQAGQHKSNFHGAWIINSCTGKQLGIREYLYNWSMARGWESKSVESQMEEAKDEQAAGGKQRLTDAERKDQIERDNLKLSRAYVVSQIEVSTNERYTESLRQALSEIDRKLASPKIAG
jgi:hypothetical protein